MSPQDRVHILEVLQILTHWMEDDMNKETKSQDVALALANRFVKDLGRLLVRTNCERAQKRALRVLTELIKQGEGYENRFSDQSDSLGNDVS